MKKRTRVWQVRSVAVLLTGYGQHVPALVPRGPVTRQTGCFGDYDPSFIVQSSGNIPCTMMHSLFFFFLVSFFFKRMFDWLGKTVVIRGRRVSDVVSPSHYLLAFYKAVQPLSSWPSPELWGPLCGWAVQPATRTQDRGSQLVLACLCHPLMTSSIRQTELELVLIGPHPQPGTLSSPFGLRSNFSVSAQRLLYFSYLPIHVWFSQTVCGILR